MYSLKVIFSHFTSQFGSELFIILSCSSLILLQLIYKYSEFRKAYTRKHKDFGEKLNYHEQVEYIADAERKSEAPSENIIADRSTIIDILERAGFSASEITVEEYDKVIQWLAQVN